MHGTRANIRHSWRNVLTSERYRIIRDTFPLVYELLESYRCHLKYLRRHTLTALLCCSPLPFDLFEKGVSKIVQLYLLPIVEGDMCRGPSVLPLKERQLTLDGTYDEHSYSEFDGTKALKSAKETLELMNSCINFLFMILSNGCVDDKKGEIRRKLLF